MAVPDQFDEQTQQVLKSTRLAKLLHRAKRDYATMNEIVKNKISELRKK